MSVIYTQGGGAASVPDATTTTSGKVRLATIAEAGGTSEAIAVTPAGLQAEISSLTSGIVYRGTIDVADFATTLASASLGDYYKISTGGTSGGVVYSVGDAIIVNSDMGGTFDDTKLDRLDNVDPSTSDEIIGNHSAANYTAANTDTLTTHLSGLDSELATFATSASLATVATSGAYADLSGTPSADDLAADHSAANYTAANANIDGHLSGIDTELATFAPIASPTFTGTPSADTATAGTSTTQLATTAFVSAAVVAAGGLSNIVEDTTPQLGGALDVNGHAITSASNGDITLDPNGSGEISIGADLVPDADATHTIGSESARYISTYSDLNGAIRFKAKNDEGAAINKGDVVYIDSVSGDVPTVKLAQANSAATMPAFGVASAAANDQAEVQIVSFGNLTAYDTTTHSLSVGDTLFVSATTAGALVNTAPAGEANLIQNIGRVVRADATSGIIKVGGAGRSAATPNLDDGKIFVGDSNNRSVATALSSIALSSLNDDLSYQPLDAGLTSIANLTTSADKMIYTDGADSYAVADLTAAGRALIDDADASAQRTTLGLVIGTDVAPIASPAFTGTPSADTATAGTNTTQLATTAFVTTAVAAGGGGSTNPTLAVQSNTSYTVTAANAPNLQLWYGVENTNAFTVTLPTITDVLTGTASSVNGDPEESFTLWVGRGYDGDITFSAADGIDGLGGDDISPYVSTFTVAAGTWVKVVGWKASGTNGNYLIERSPYGDLQPLDAGLTSIAGLTTSADKMIYTDGADSYAVADLTAAGRALIDDADASAQRTTLGLVIGTDVAPIASPTFTGTPSADTATAGTNTTQLATTAFVTTAVAAGGGLANIVEDTSPELGGDLSMNGHAFSTDILPTSSLRTVGDTSAQWGGLYLKDNGKVVFGDDQDVELIHDPDDGLILDLSVADGANDPQFMLRSQTSSSSGPRLKLLTESASPAANDAVGSFVFSGRDSGGIEQEYASIKSRIVDPTAGAELGKISILPYPASANNRGLHVEASSVTNSKVNIDHDGGTYGLHLNNVLVTPTAAELNLLDGGSTVGASITIADTDGFVVNDGGVTKLIPALDLKTYAGGGGGGTAYTYSAITGGATSAAVWYHYSVDTSGGAATLNLPALSTLTDGDEIRVKLRVAGNDLTIDANSTETIDGGETLVLDVATSSVTLVAGSTEWEVI